MLSGQPQPEFPAWLHHQIMEQAASHDRKRLRLKHKFRLQAIPALAAIALSLFMGVAIGKTAYRKMNPLPENAAELYSQQNAATDTRDLAVFGESTLSEDLY